VGDPKQRVASIKVGVLEMNHNKNRKKQRRIDIRDSRKFILRCCVKTNAYKYWFHLYWLTLIQLHY